MTVHQCLALYSFICKKQINNIRSFCISGNSLKELVECISRMKHLVLKQYTLFDSSRFIHSDCGSLPVKMAMPTGEHCWKKNSGAPWARTSNLWIPSLTRSPLRYLGRYAKLLYSAIVLSQCYTSLRLACTIILYKQYYWAWSSICEHIILPISLKAVFFVLIKVHAWCNWYTARSCSDV